MHIYIIIPVDLWQQSLFLYYHPDLQNLIFFDYLTFKYTVQYLPITNLKNTCTLKHSNNATITQQTIDLTSLNQMYGF